MAGKKWFYIFSIIIISQILFPFLSICQDSSLKEMKGQIVFSSNRSGAWGVWMIQADGTQLRQITKGEADASDVDPRFSADGKMILFSSTRGGKTGIWKMALDGSGVERICDGDQGEWSPDGKQIAFRRDEKIFIRDLSSHQEKPITPADWPHCSGPAWSPDGKSLAFACRWEAGNGIYIVGIEEGKPFKVYDQKGACEPHWSADGKLLVYETETHICTIQPDGKKNRPVTFFGGIQRYGQWNPEGKYIVYCQSASESGPWELYIISGGGGTPMRLTEGGSDMNPDWH